MMQDTRYAVRLLARHPGFALTAIGSIAVGIAACTAIVSLVYTLLFRPLDVARAGDIVSIYGSSKVSAGFGGISAPDYRDLAASAGVFEELAGYIRLPAFMDAGDESEHVITEVATGNYHAVFGLRPAHGRLMTPDDDRPGAPLVAVLGHRFWRQRFGANPHVVGTHVRINNQPVEIVGVAPPTFAGILIDWYGAPDLWMPFAQLGAINSRFARLKASERRNMPILQLAGRVRPGVTVEQVNAVLRGQAQRLAREYPASNAERTFVALSSAHARFWPGRRGAAMDLATVLLISVAVLLLIAVLNVANLLIARLYTRAREISIRLAIGAARVRVVRQLLVEGLVLSGVATIVSIPLSTALTHLLAQLHMPFFVSRRGLDLSPDWRVFAIVATVSLVCGLLLGVLPAWQAWRADVRSGMTSMPAHALTLPAAGRWDPRQVLAALQIAVCLTLTVGAALLGKSLIGLTQQDLGFRPDGITLFSLETFMRDYTGEQNHRLQRELIARVSRLPGVESAAFASDVIPTRFLPMKSMIAVNAADPALRGGVVSSFNVVTSTYFDTVRLPLAAGRVFRDADSVGTEAIVDEATARRGWGSAAGAIGQRIRIDKETADREIVGVAREASFRDAESSRPYVFLPLDFTANGGATLHVRGPRQLDLLAEQVKRELRAIDRSLAFSDITTYDEFAMARFAAPSLAAQLAVAASVMGFMLAMIGLYAVLAYLVSQRQSELAIRMALGAAPDEIWQLIARAGVKVTLGGVTLGILASLATMRVIATQLRGVDTHDPLVYLTVVALVFLAGMAASWFPARRAARLDPWTILQR